MNMKTGKNGEASPGRLPIFSKSRRVLPPEPRTGIRTPSLMADQKPLISDSPTNSVTTTGGAATSCLLVVDQYGRPVLLVSRLKADGSELKAAIPVSEYGSDPKRFWQRLERAGIAVHNPATRKLIKRTLEGDLEAGDSVTMAYKSGWANLSTFVMRDGEVIPPAPPTAAVYTFFDTNPNGGFVGTLAGWKAGIEQNLEGQLLLQALTCLPFVTPLLEPYGHLAGIVDNPGLNICGVSSSGKTTGAICMLSVSGKCPDALNSWQMTDIAPETLMRAHGGMSPMDFWDDYRHALWWLTFWAALTPGSLLGFAGFLLVITWAVKQRSNRSIVQKWEKEDIEDALYGQGLSTWDEVVEDPDAWKRGGSRDSDP